MLLIRYFLTSGLLLAAGMASAQVFKEPERGSALRTDLMDALRPLVEQQLGPPVEFVVEQLRVAGGVAFANVNPQRPGGGRIDLATTPIAIAAGGDWGFEGVGTQALYRREGSQWVVAHMAVGATDVWWANPELCPEFGAVIPEVC
jgi:hypothetical protein